MKVSHHIALPVPAPGAAFWKVSAASGVALAMGQQLRAPTAATSVLQELLVLPAHLVQPLLQPEHSLFGEVWVGRSSRWELCLRE